MHACGSAYQFRGTAELVIAIDPAGQGTLIEVRADGARGELVSCLADAVPADDRPDDSYEASQLRAATMAALGSLPPSEQQAITMFYLRELPLKEVGAQLGVSESRACQLCGQGTKRLREALRAVVA